MFTLNVTVQDDPTQVAEWLATFEQHYARVGCGRAPSAQGSGGPTPASSADEEPELQSELERFRQNWPTYSKRFTRLHEGLVALGYRPVLPMKRKATSVRGYIAYHLPNGQRVFENNSSTAYFVGSERVNRLRGSHEWIKDSGQNVSVQFDTDAKVGFILELAQAELE